MNKDIIFIHIPKTGGTTINSAMKGTYWQTEPDFNYRHIIPKYKRSNTKDIFEVENYDKFKSYKIFMMLRNPLDRIISEYYFFNDKKTYINLLHPKPNNFEEFALHSQTPNYVLAFLLGNKLYDKKRPNRNDLEIVKKAIDEIGIHVGVFEHFADSLSYFSKVTGIEWSNNIQAQRVTFKRPRTEDISPELKQKILEANALDLELYDYCLEKFKTFQKALPKSKLKFNKDRYNHVIQYCAKSCLFEFCMDNKYYIRQNFQFFKGLTFYLLKDKKVRNGRKFVQIWNETFLKAVNEKHPNTSFSEALNNVFDSESDPLASTYNIGKAIDTFFEKNKKEANKFYKSMDFSPAQIVEPKVVSKGLFSRLFGK